MTEAEPPFTVCGQTVLLSNAALADAFSVLPEQTRNGILRYYFLRQLQHVYWPVTQHSRAVVFRVNRKI